ncbi:MAG: hypothetical protein LBG59_05080 [Candidatus Peribacteria bacterium]|nr:hypothetical protein [Candidatus Peribacteria bacterium]
MKFRDNTDVAKLRNDTAYKATSRDNSALQKKVLNTLDTFQHLDVGNLKWTLFGGKNLNIANVHANLALPDISKVLSATTNIDTEIDHFVQNVHKNSNPFLIQSSKLYTKPDDTQREVAIRMALYLYRIYWLADQGKLNDAQAAAFEKIINDLQNNEIPQFK